MAINNGYENGKTGNWHPPYGQNFDVHQNYQRAYWNGELAKKNEIREENRKKEDEEARLRTLNFQSNRNDYSDFSEETSTDFSTGISNDYSFLHAFIVFILGLVCLSGPSSVKNHTSVSNTSGVEGVDYMAIVGNGAILYPAPKEVRPSKKKYWYYGYIKNGVPIDRISFGSLLVVAMAANGLRKRFAKYLTAEKLFFSRILVSMKNGKIKPAK